MKKDKSQSNSSFIGHFLNQNQVDDILDTASIPHLKDSILGRSNIGYGRDKNQDALGAYVSTNETDQPTIILAIADGLGCYGFSEKASLRAVIQIPVALHEGADVSETCKNFHADILKALPFALKQISKPSNKTQSAENSHKPSEEFFSQAHTLYSGQDCGATTLVLAAIKNNHATIANIGDSRCYHIRDKKVIYQTFDQSMLNLLLSQNLIPNEPELLRRHPIKNVILNALGGSEKTYEIPHNDQIIIKETGLPVIDEIELQPNDYLILATDGTFSNISIEEIIDLIESVSWEELNDKISESIQNVFKSNKTSFGDLPNPDNYTYLIYKHLEK